MLRLKVLSIASIFKLYMVTPCFVIVCVCKGKPGPKGVSGKPGRCGRNGGHGLDGQIGPPGLPGPQVRTTSTYI